MPIDSVAVPPTFFWVFIFMIFVGIAGIGLFLWGFVYEHRRPEIKEIKKAYKDKGKKLNLFYDPSGAVEFRAAGKDKRKDDGTYEYDDKKYFNPDYYHGNFKPNMTQKGLVLQHFGYGKPFAFNSNNARAFKKIREVRDKDSYPSLHFLSDKELNTLLRIEDKNLIEDCDKVYIKSYDPDLEATEIDKARFEEWVSRLPDHEFITLSNMIKGGGSVIEKSVENLKRDKRAYQLAYLIHRLSEEIHEEPISEGPFSFDEAFRNITVATASEDLHIYEEKWRRLAWEKLKGTKEMFVYAGMGIGIAALGVGFAVYLVDVLK